MESWQQWVNNSGRPPAPATWLAHPTISHEERLSDPASCQILAKQIFCKPSVHDPEKKISSSRGCKTSNWKRKECPLKPENAWTCCHTTYNYGQKRRAALPLWIISFVCSKPLLKAKQRKRSRKFCLAKIVSTKAVRFLHSYHHNEKMYLAVTCTGACRVPRCSVPAWAGNVRVEICKSAMLRQFWRRYVSFASLPFCRRHPHLWDYAKMSVRHLATPGLALNWQRVALTTESTPPSFMSFTSGMATRSW